MLCHHGDQREQPRLPARAHDRWRGAARVVAAHHLPQLAVEVERGEMGGEGEGDAQQCVEWHLGAAAEAVRPVALEQKAEHP
eukprot:scaffold56777_cov64-Phaeocystis_antarctica.AAC.9